MNQTVEFPAFPSFSRAVEDGEVIEQSGYHKPQGRRGHLQSCGCSLTTPKGAYRDVTVELGGLTIHYYHQSAVVVTDGTRYAVNNHGYRTATTKERINRYLPRGYFVRQRDFEWFLESPDGGEVEFENRMIVDAGTD